MKHNVGARLLFVPSPVSVPPNAIDSMGCCFSTVPSQRVTPPTVPAPVRSPLDDCNRTEIIPDLNILELKLPLSIFDDDSPVRPATRNLRYSTAHPVQYRKENERKQVYLSEKRSKEQCQIFSSNKTCCCIIIRYLVLHPTRCSQCPVPYSTLYPPDKWRTLLYGTVHTVLYCSCSITLIASFLSTHQAVQIQYGAWSVR